MAAEFSAQRSLEHYLLARGIVSRRQLEVAKKIQRSNHGPLPILLWQMSFISINQLGTLLDWSPS